MTEQDLLGDVWIELQPPSRNLSPEERDRVGKARAGAANRMLRRLTKDEDADNMPRFSWSSHERAYLFGGAMGSGRLLDNGTWLHLKYLGREE